MTDLPAPECKLGYPATQLEGLLGLRMNELNEWMIGQTFTSCDGRQYNYKLGKYEPTGCGPHGYVYYSHDVKKFLAGLPVTD